jgi:hypothetical protein
MKLFKNILSCFLITGFLLAPVCSFADTCGQTKPPLGSQINYAHPLSRRLVGCWLFNERERRRENGKPIISNKIDYSWRKKWQDNLTEKLKMAIRAKARRALKSGKIKKQPCEICGNITTEMHHDNYAKPLEVRWFCDLHHAKTRLKAEGGK